MQAEQDRSVQNLTNLLQPLSPSGSIPGIGDGTNVPPPPLDIEDILNPSGEYFNDFPGEGPDYDFATNGSGFNFENLPEVDDGPLFGDVGTDDQQQEFDAFKSSQTEEDGGGRVESVTSSEVTTPPTTVDTESMTMKSRGQRYNEVDGGKSPAKRRRRNA
jgi:heat shock transcription factor